MILKIDADVKKWATPNFVVTNRGTIHVRDAGKEVLEQLCQQFREDILSKAGYATGKGPTIKLKTPNTNERER